MPEVTTALSLFQCLPPPVRYIFLAPLPNTACADTPEVTTALLKFMAEFVLNKTQVGRACPYKCFACVCPAAGGPVACFALVGPAAGSALMPFIAARSTATHQ